MTNRDAHYVRSTGKLRGCEINDPILVFGQSVNHSELLLHNIYYDLKKIAQEVVSVKRGSFEIKVDNLIGKIIVEKYGVKEYSLEEFNKQYLNNWTINAEFIKTCGECEDFGPDGCVTSRLESKYGTATTPACEDFKEIDESKTNRS